MSLWPHLLMALVATLGAVKQRLRTGRTWVNLSMCVVATGVGLAWHERSVLILPLVAGTLVVMSPAVGWRRITETLRTFWVLWLAYAAGIGAYLWMHATITTVQSGTSDATVRDYLELSGVYVFENALPGLVGGPWLAEVRGGAVIPPTWVSVVSGLCVLAIVIALLARGRSDARWALALVIVYMGADLALILAGRVGFGRILAYDPRYSADLVLPAVLAAALALRRMPRRPGRGRRRSSWLSARPLGPLAVTGVVLVACALGTAPLVPHFQNPLDRAYWDNVRADLAEDPSQVLLDEYVPPEILLPLLGEEALASRVLVLLPETPVFDEPSPRLRRITDTGALEEMDLVLPTAMRPGRDGECGYAVSDRARWVRMRQPLQGGFVFRVSYFTDVAADVRVRAGDHDTRFRASPGPNDVWVVVPEQDEVRGIRFEQEDPRPSGTVCIAGLVAGVPEAS